MYLQPKVAKKFAFENQNIWLSEAFRDIILSSKKGKERKIP
jgi:hypothetical protein